MAAPLMRIDLSGSSALALCRACASWRGSVHTGPEGKRKAIAEFDAHRRTVHATAARNTAKARRRSLVVNL